MRSFQFHSTYLTYTCNKGDFESVKIFVSMIEAAVLAEKISPEDASEIFKKGFLEALQNHHWDIVIFFLKDIKTDAHHSEVDSAYGDKEEHVYTHDRSRFTAAELEDLAPDPYVSKTDGTEINENAVENTKYDRNMIDLQLGGAIPSAWKTKIRKHQKFIFLPTWKCHLNIEESKLLHLLFYEAYKYDKNICKLIIKFGIKSGWKNFSLNSFIEHLSSLCGDMIRYYIEECGADLEIKDGIKGTALCVAASSSDCKHIVRLLINNKADPYACDFIGNTVLHFSAINGWTDLLEELIQTGMNPSVPNKLGRTPLILAVMHNRSDVVKFLESKNVDIKQSDPKLGPAICAAATYHSNLETLSYLSRGEIDFSATNPFGNTPIHIAVANFHVALSEIYNEYLGYNQKRHNQIVSALKKTINYFLIHKVDINAKNKHDNTALHFAAANVHFEPELIQFLLDNKADPTIRNRDGLSPYDIARQYGHARFEPLLITHAETKDCKIEAIHNKKNVGKNLCLFLQTSAHYPHLSQEHKYDSKDFSTPDVLKGFPPLAVKDSKRWNEFFLSILHTRDDGSFYLKKKLSRGGFGKVKEAYHISEQRPVVVKILSLDEVESDGSAPGFWPSHAKEIQTEITVLKSMGLFAGSGSVLKRNRDLKINKKVYIFQEKRSGQPLRGMDDKDTVDLTLDPMNALRAMLSAATDLHLLHKQGFAHVDLSLRNLIYNPFTRECHLIDFGMAAKFGATEFNFSALDKTPELNSQNPLEPSYDVYLLGKIILNTFKLDVEHKEGGSNQILFGEIRKLVSAMTQENPKERPPLIECILKLFKLYDEALKQRPSSRVEITIPDYRRKLSFIVLMDIFESCLRRCENADNPSISGIQYEDSNNKVNVQLNFDGTIQLLQPGNVAVNNCTLGIDAEGHLKIIETTEPKPDIAADLLASLRKDESSDHTCQNAC